MNLATLAQRYAALWLTIADSVRKTDALFDRLQGTARELGVSNPVDRFISPARVIEAARHDMFNSLIRAAAGEFASCGQPVDIDRKAFAEFLPACAHGEDVCNLPFDPVAMAAKLTALYGGAAGKEKALRQIARGVIDFFRIQPGSAISVKRGGVVLVTSMRLDDFDKKWGRCNLCYYSRDKLRNGNAFLARFATWAGDLDTSLALEKWLKTAYDPVPVVSRQVIPLAGLSVVTYQSRFEFRFSPALSSQLQVFLGLYGGLNEEAA